MKNPPLQPFSRTAFVAPAVTVSVNAYLDVLGANVLNATIAAAVVAITLKMAAGGMFVAAGGLLLPFAFLAYLTLTDAWLMQ